MPLPEIQHYLSWEQGHTKLLFVNDGSKDNTKNVLDALQKEFPDKVHCLHLEKNSGKAEAIRLGMHHIEQVGIDYDYAGFMDADMSTPLTEIANFQDAIERFSRPSMIIGSRIKLFGSTHIVRSDRRHYVGRIIATFISKSIKLPIYDTQCGFKFIRRDRINVLFSEAFTSRWLFDVELIFRLLKLTGYAAIEGDLFELPVSNWEEKGDSRIPLSYAFRMPIELIKIRKRYMGDFN
jgi:glycosyltransferase involved in cell wall biosynthesis